MPIGYFESWNLESLQGVLDAAEADPLAGDHRLQRRVSQPRRPACRRNDWLFTARWAGRRRRRRRSRAA